MPTTARNILVTYGSERGGTAELAIAVGAALRDRGHVVTCIPAYAVHDVEAFDAVIVGGALYAMRWHKDARRLVARNAAALRARPTWLFSSGPLDASASASDIPPVGQVAGLAARIDARGHKTFGGRLAPDAKGFIAHAMAKKHAGDWRDWDGVDAWAGSIAEVLDREPLVAPVIPVAAVGPAAPAVPARWPLAVVLLAVGLAAIAGGLALVIRPDGALLRMQASVLDGTPFTSFLVPGLVLLAVIGVANTVAGALVLRDRAGASTAAFAGGALLFAWIVAEMLLLGTANGLQLAFLAIAVVLMGLAVRRLRPRSAQPV